MDEYRNFIIDTLNEHGVEFKEFGKNISSKAIGVRCIYCDDTSTHMGVMTDKLNCTCWKCKESVSFAKYMSDHTGLPIHNFFLKDRKRPIRDLTPLVQRILVEKSKKRYSKDIIGDSAIKEEPLPPGSLRVNYGDDYPLLLEWQKRRKIHRSMLVKYGCHICFEGKFRNRLIVPVLYNKLVVGFVGLDLTGKSSVKAKNSSNAINDYLYNYDSVPFGGSVIITEGILDSWAVNGVATLGTHLTPKQRLLLKAKKPKIIIVMRDGDAYMKGRKKSKLSDCADQVIHVKLPEKEDPDSLGRNKCYELIREKLKQFK
jgi:hypothetical protein